jgi:hypothetical protein
MKDSKMERWKDGKMERWKDGKIESSLFQPLTNYL